MNKKLFSINKIICLFFIVLCFLLITCNDSSDTSNNNDDDNNYENPNAGIVRELTFSNDSGLYPAQFNLTITAEKSDIYYTTDGSVPVPEKAGTTKYSAPITIKNRNGEANKLASYDRQFYMADGDPRGSLPTIYYPTKDQVPKATVIRAIAVNSSGKKSGVATKTYFIGDNLKDYGNIRVVSLVSDPDNLVSEDRGIMVRGKESNRWDSTPPYNYRMKGADWERPAHLEIFEGSASSRSVALSEGVGIRVRGGWSRGLGQKSFTVYFKEQYGINNLRNYNLIPKDTTLGTTGAVKADGKTPVERYKGFMLRNGANDCEYTKFYDVFLQDLLSDRSFATQASVPCVVYLNGEYWGPYNFQERYSDNHTEYKYGVKKENVISYDNDELDDGEPGEEELFKKMVGTTNYTEFCKLVDIDNFIDYWASEIYIYNEDWPQNNYRIWRTRNVESGNYYGDTKWRYEMFDTEFAMGIYNSGRTTGQKGVDAFNKILNGEHNEHPNNKLFKVLLANPEFCKKFVNTIMDLYNVNFHPDNYLPKLNKYAEVYSPLMNGYFKRWGSPWDTAYQNKVDEAKKYLNDIRNVMVYNYLPTYFSGYSGIANIGVSSGNLYDVTLSVTGVSGTTIKINTITPNISSGSWTGKYYSSVPITVTASAAPSGYVFDGWAVTGGTPATSSAQTTTVTLTGNTQITAKYRLNQAAAVPVTGVTLDPVVLNLTTGGTSVITANVTPSNATYKNVYWSSDKPNVARVDNTGKVTAVSSGTAVITATTTESISKTCTVNVAAAVTSVDLDTTSIKMFVGDKRELIATISPSTAPNKQTNWNSSNNSVATVANGIVTAKAAGTATITVITVDGNVTKGCTVKVNEIKDAEVFVDLAKVLKDVAVPVDINYGNDFNDLFGGLPIGPAGWLDPEKDVTFKIINEDGVKKLQINAYALWGPGLDIKAGVSGIAFQAGDRIQVKGRIQKIRANNVVLNIIGDKYVPNNNYWEPLQGWSSSGQFEEIFTLTQYDADTININQSVRIRPDGIEPWEGRDPNGIAIIYLEQVLVYGLRD